MVESDYTEFGLKSEVLMPRQNQEWRSRVQEIFQVCQEEIKRTTDIGKKMLTASKTNSCLHTSYEELGMLVYKEVAEGRLEWNHPRLKEIMATIQVCESELDTIEKEVNKIKFNNPGINDVSKDVPKND